MSRPSSPSGLPVRLTASTASAVLAVSTAMVLGAAPAAATDVEPSSVVYADALAAGWSDWSWGGSRDLQATGGPNRGRVVSWRTDRPWGALYLHAAGRVPATPGATVQLSVKPVETGVRLDLMLFGNDLRPVGTRHALQAPGAALPAGVWTTVRVPVSQLGVASGQDITGLAVQDVTGTSGKRVEIDDISIVRAAPAQPPTTAPSAVEIRPGNATPNATRGRPTDPSRFFGYEGFRPYYAKVDGDFTGTTEEILAWAAAKWGMGTLGYPDLAKAIAVHESWWRQEAVGQKGERGIVQVHPGWPDSGPAAWSTAYAADYGMAVIRHHYDGASWLGDATRGNLRNAVAAWECGCGWGGGRRYPQLVFASHETKVWRRPGVAPDWF